MGFVVFQLFYWFYFWSILVHSIGNKEPFGTHSWCSVSGKQHAQQLPGGNWEVHLISDTISIFNSAQQQLPCLSAKHQTCSVLAKHQLVLVGHGERESKLDFLNSFCVFKLSCY